MYTKVGTVLVAAALIIVAFLFILMSSGTVAHAQGTKDPCRDEAGNEICPHYNSGDMPLIAA